MALRFVGLFPFNEGCLLRLNIFFVMVITSRNAALSQLLHLHYFIKSRQRGSRNDIAERLGIGKNKLADMLHLLINFGAEISYNKSSGCYQYDNEFDFFVGPVRNRDLVT